MERYQLLQTIFERLSIDGAIDAQFVRKHRLENYLFHFGNSSDTAARFKHDSERIVDLHKDKERFLKDFYNKTGVKPLIIKGFSTYYLIKHEGLIRKSNDIDLFVEEPSKYIEKLVQNGFLEIVSPNAHEYSTLIKDTIEIDLHKYFIVRAYPSDIGEHPENSEIVTKEKMYDSGQIHFGEILEHAVEFPYCFVPNATFSVLISCINLFNDYIVGFAKTPCIKLIECIEIIELRENENFNGELFKALTAKYNAFDAVSFTNDFIRDLTGETLFKDAEMRYSRYPQLFYWNFNTWVTPDETTDVLTVDSLEKISFPIKPTVIDLNAPAVTYSNKSKESPLRGIEKNSSGNTPEIRLTMKWKRDLFVIVEVKTRLSIRGDIIHINTGGIRRTFHGSKIEYIDKHLYEYIPGTHGYTVIFKINEKDMPALNRVRKLRMIVFVEQKTERSVSSNHYLLELTGTDSEMR
ncbi:hypothetical protein ACFSL6_22610 [Paenibacillus thailandensis]|uniref:Nucleotidyltransferase family protein n=1 Tax=Paenibacillus thailandensis TaxID=393250 RepID=A0ABW5R1Z6_9BACL